MQSIRLMIQLFGENIIIWHITIPLIQMNSVTDFLEIGSSLLETGNLHRTQSQNALNIKFHN